jgi:hypothetical protein
MSRLALWLLCFAIGTGASSLSLADRGEDEDGHGWGEKKDWKKGWEHDGRNWDRHSRWGSDPPYIRHGHLPTPGEYRLWYPDLPPGHQPPPQPRFMLRGVVVVLNAPYAVPRPLARPVPDDRIQQMATYDLMMLNALQLPTDTLEQRGARDRAIADARIELAAATRRRLNPTAVSRIDSLLGLPASDPALGVQ